MLRNTVTGISHELLLLLLLLLVVVVITLMQGICNYTRISETSLVAVAYSVAAILCLQFMAR
jgi:hypothetical protein